MGIGPVIVLDTHVWVWWVHGDSSLPAAMVAEISRHEAPVWESALSRC